MYVCNSRKYSNKILYTYFKNSISIRNIGWQTQVALLFFHYSSKHKRTRMFKFAWSFVERQLKFYYILTLNYLQYYNAWPMWSIRIQASAQNEKFFMNTDFKLYIITKKLIIKMFSLSLKCLVFKMRCSDSYKKSFVSMYHFINFF